MAATRPRPARKLSKLERALAICLSLVWVGGGCVVLGVGLIHARWIMTLCAAAAIGYGIAWARVAVLSRLLTWPRLLMPWRPGK
jgi:hypothetical protein